jgi:3-methylcrotonyl-CoA carboxylase alpha subunit
MQRRDAVLWYGRDELKLEFSGTEAKLQFAPGKDARLEVDLGGLTEAVAARWSGRNLHLTTPRGEFDLHWVDPFASQSDELAGANRIAAPMPGTVTRVLAQPGTDLPRGAPLLVLEAMKMEHTLRAPGDGRLKAFKCAVGDFVQEGTELADFELAAE